MKLKRRNYFLDFFCPAKRLVVEIDGGIHDSQIEYDKNRDKFFQELGYTVLRFKTLEIETEIKDVIRRIKLKLDAMPFSLPRRRVGMR